MLVGSQFTLPAAKILLRRSQGEPPDALPVRVMGGRSGDDRGLIAVAGAAGLGAGFTASPLPNAAAQLRTTGMYRWVRQPIYSGLLLTFTGWTINSGDRQQLLLSTVLLRYKTDFEENALQNRFPAYSDYSRSTPWFVPSPRHDRSQFRITTGPRGCCTDNTHR